MKHLGLLALFSVILMGCQNEINNAKGTYSYKISGNATISETFAEDNLALTDTNYSIPLPDEIGAMEIIPVRDNDVLLTFNPINDGVYIVTANLKNDTVNFEPFKRNIHLSTIHQAITVEGEGHIYGNNIIFQLRYVGKHLKADNVVMIAKKN